MSDPVDVDDAMAELLGDFNEVQPEPGVVGSLEAEQTEQAEAEQAEAEQAGSLESQTEDLVVPESAEPRPPTESRPPANLADMPQEVYTQFQAVTEEILNNFRADRRQAEAIVQHMWEVVQSQHGAAAQHYVQALVSALGVKTEVNANAVKILEANAKLLSAGKGVFINLNTGSGDDQELDQVLSRPFMINEVD